MFRLRSHGKCKQNPHREEKSFLYCLVCMCVCLCDTHLPVVGVSLLLRVCSEGVEPHRTMMIGQRPEVEVIKLKRKRKLLQDLNSQQEEDMGLDKQTLKCIALTTSLTNME